MKHRVWMIHFLLLILSPSSLIQAMPLRVVGGTEAVPGQFPYMALLKRTGYSCSASIVSERWVISAAHCIERNNTKLYNVTAGIIDLNGLFGHIQNRNVSRLIPHPNFVHYRNSTTDTAIFDICLVQVQKAFMWNQYVQPVRLACFSIAFLFGECIGVGFGLRNVSARERASLVPPQNQRKALARLVLPEKLSFLGLRNPARPCPELKDPRFPLEHQLCSIEGEVGKRHIYLGDSGGPLVCMGLQVGVFSALEPSYGPKNEAVIVQVHTSVPYFYPWILENMSINGTCDGPELRLDA